MKIRHGHASKKSYSRPVAGTVEGQTAESEVYAHMGMDYRYAGSSSYPRFDRELCEIAKLIGAIETDHLIERKKTEDSRPFGYWFGFLSSDEPDKLKFAIPETIPGAVAKWLNRPYEAMTPEETKLVWDVISDHPKIREISPQIYTELEELSKRREGWDIS